nr:hypothetical protein [Vibrio cholerae]
MLVEGAKEVLRLNESELDTPVPDVTVALQGLIRHGSRTYITMSQKLMSDFINGDCDMARHLSLFATEDKKEINDAFAWRPPMASHQDTLMVTFGDAESTLPGAEMDNLGIVTLIQKVLDRDRTGLNHPVEMVIQTYNPEACALVEKYTGIPGWMDNGNLFDLVVTTHVQFTRPHGKPYRSHSVSLKAKHNFKHIDNLLPTMPKLESGVVGEQYLAQLADKYIAEAGADQYTAQPTLDDWNALIPEFEDKFLFTIPVWLLRNLEEKGLISYIGYNSVVGQKRKALLEASEQDPNLFVQFCLEWIKPLIGANPAYLCLRQLNETDSDNCISLLNYIHIIGGGAFRCYIESEQSKAITAESIVLAVFYHYLKSQQDLLQIGDD